METWVEAWIEAWMDKWKETGIDGRIGGDIVVSMGGRKGVGMSVSMGRGMVGVSTDRGIGRSWLVGGVLESWEEVKVEAYAWLESALAEISAEALLKSSV